MRKLLVAALALGFLGMVQAADDVEIKDVMKIAMKGGLCKKVATGKANDAEKKKLVELFTALSKAKPPKGDAASWKAKTGALLKAATAVAKGDEKAGKALAKAANCKACHSVHK